MNWDWLDKHEEQMSKNKDYFEIKEGSNKFVLLSHIAPLAQVWDGSKYRVAEEGDKNVSIKGICWVLQNTDEGYVIKQAKLPYKVVKAIRGYSEDPEWDFKFPFPHPLNLNAKGAGEKTVEYTVQASPKAIEIPQDILDELAKKPTPEEIVEKIRGKKEEPNTDNYPVEDIKPEDIPF